MPIPSDRLHDWQVGVNLGVRGGIAQFLVGGAEERITEIEVTGADNTGIIDCTTEVQAAVDAAIAANNGSVVKFPDPGTYLCSGITGGLFPKNFTIRGATSNKADTVIRYNGAASGRLFAFGNGSSWNEPSADNVVTAGNTQGSTTVTIADATPFSAGQLMRIEWENQLDDTKIEAGTPPVLHTYGFDYVRNQTVLITSTTATTITFTPGILHDPDPDLAARVRRSTFPISGIGIEDLTIDGNDNDPYSLVEFVDAFDCWVHNCDVRKALNYNVVFASSVFMEVLSIVVRNRTGGGTNGAGILSNNVTGMLVENSTLFDLAPCIEWNFCTTGVFGYNFWDGTANFNHGPHNDFIVMEGCIGPTFQLDGYFGTIQRFTAVRNWVTGVLYAGTQAAISALNRFTRETSYQGNIFGNSAWPYGATPYSDGNPNLGNSDFTGTAAPTTGDFWADWKATGTLTTRSSDTTGAITLDSPASIVTARFRSYIKWGSNFVELTSVVASTPQVFTFVIDGVLPAEATALTFFAGPEGYQEQDQDVTNTAHRQQNRFINDESNGIISGEESVEVIPDSVYRDSAPAFMSGYTWPPISSADSTPSYDVIPASVRYIDDYASNSAPEITTPCTVTGSGTELAELTAVPGEVTGSPPPTITFKWQKDGVDIDGATSITYTPPIGFVGSDVGPVQIATNTEGSDESVATPIEITPFMGDILVLNQTANSNPVTELVRRAAVVDGVAGALADEIILHSTAYPQEKANNYAYAPVRGNGDRYFVADGTWTLAEMRAWRNANDPL